MSINKLESSIAFYAFRYCLGRKTYAVLDCVEYLLLNWDFLEERDKSLIVKEIQEAIRNKQAGMDMDVEQWSRILDRAIGGH